MKNPAKKVDKRFQKEQRPALRSLKDILKREETRRKKVTLRYEKWKLEREKRKRSEINKTKSPI